MLRDSGFMLKRGKNKDKKISAPVLGLGIALVLPSTTSLANLTESQDDDPTRLAPPRSSVRHGLTWKVPFAFMRPSRNRMANKASDDKANDRASLTPPKAIGAKTAPVSPSPSLLGSRLHVLRRTTSRSPQLATGSDATETKTPARKSKSPTKVPTPLVRKISAKRPTPTFRRNRSSSVASIHMSPRVVTPTKSKLLIPRTPIGKHGSPNVEVVAVPLRKTPSPKRIPPPPMTPPHGQQRVRRPPNLRRSDSKSSRRSSTSTEHSSPLAHRTTPTSTGMQMKSISEQRVINTASAVMTSIPKAESVASIQIPFGFDYGFGCGMIRDESVPMSVLLAETDSDTPSLTSGSGHSTGSTALSSTSEGFLQDEMAPFEIGTGESNWSLFQPNTTSMRRIQLPPSTYSPNRKLKVAELTSTTSEESEGTDSIEWPLPPKRRLVIMGHTGEVFVEPDVEYSKSSSLSLSSTRRHSVRFSSDSSPPPVEKSRPSQSRTQRVKLSNIQLETIAEYHHIPPKPPIPDKGLKQATAKPRLTMSKITEAKVNVDSESADGYFGETILLSTTFDPDALNRLTITSSNWVNLRAFCEGNSGCVVAAVEADQEKRLVLVIADNGVDGVVCTFHLDGIRGPLAENVVTWMTIPLPVTLCEVWTRCAGSTLSKGRAPGERAQSMLSSSVGPRFNEKRIARYLSASSRDDLVGPSSRRSDGAIRSRY